jgi:hypothetical protein
LPIQSLWHESLVFSSQVHNNVKDTGTNPRKHLSASSKVHNNAVKKKHREKQRSSKTHKRNARKALCFFFQQTSQQCLQII